jgi:tetratricopeptide (TPR) repeat protein
MLYQGTHAPLQSGLICQLANRARSFSIVIWGSPDVSPAVLRKQEMLAKVNALFGWHLLRSDVIASLRKDVKLNATDREFAIEVARTHSEDQEKLNEAAWQTARVPGRTEEEYQLALRQAEAAVQGSPNMGYYLCTMGVAQYRLGRFTDALTTLSEAKELSLANLTPILAFLAMACHQRADDVGKLKGETSGLTALATTYYQRFLRKEAQAILARLREIVSNEPVATKDQATRLLCEAEELLVSCELEEMKDGNTSDNRK